MIEGLGRGSRDILVGKRSAVHCLQKVSHDVRHVVPSRIRSELPRVLCCLLKRHRIVLSGSCCRLPTDVDHL